MRPRKKVMQWMKESGIPYCLRPHVPGCYYKGELVAVPFVGVDEAFWTQATLWKAGSMELIWEIHCEGGHFLVLWRPIIEMTISPKNPEN